MARAGVAIPKTVMARHPSQVQRALQIVGGPPAILKLVRGTQGIGVILAETEQAAQQVVETLWSLGMTVLVQEFIEESEGRDVRVIVVGKRAVAAMRRQARLGEFRSNVHRGAAATAVDRAPGLERLALKACRALHLDVAGVDVLESRSGPKVLEVNSSPGLEGIERATGKDVASAIVEHAVETARRARRRRQAAS
ncbi:MAG TPA: RimK family alpha-L-glutamate ligase [Candidatus Polarisedimenticolia bacterium]|nr:RimK family alpha-L-glutamate ligase [Candidatus Polarisedimenticolia bacterium]